MSKENDDSITTEEALDRYDDPDASHPPDGTGETGPTMSSESVRLPEHVVEYYEKQARRRGLGKTTMMRVALMEWMEQKQRSSQFSQSTTTESAPAQNQPDPESKETPGDPGATQPDEANQPSTSQPENTTDAKQDEETPGPARP